MRRVSQPGAWFNRGPSSERTDLPGCRGRQISNPQPNPQFVVSCTSYGYFGSPRVLVSGCKTYPGYCHGRGREFESRRPRHSFQRSCFNFGQTIEDAKRPRVAALSRPFCALFFCYMAAASCVVEPNDSEVSEEKTNDSTAACASCFAGLIAWV